jgi:GxxExxY protein
MAPKNHDGLFHSLTERIIGLAIEVHRTVGPGLLESTYEECLHWELCAAGLVVARQVVLPVLYKGQKLRSVYRLDLLVENSVIVDIKSVDQVAAIHEAQMLTYLRHASLKIGLILNFKSVLLRDGIHRIAL